MIAVRPRSLDGGTRIQTRNEVLHLEDGVVAGVFSAETDAAVESALVGMRIVGWVGDDDRLHAEFIPGARAIFWRREIDGERTSLALTGRAVAFSAAKRTVTGSITLVARTYPSRRGVRSEPRPRSGVRRSSRA
jgi:hypothetical protein